MLNIFYGRESVDKENFIYSHLDKQSRALIIVPDQYTLEAERKLFEKTGAEALMDIEVISMSRLGSRLLNELGGSRRVFADKYGRQMLLTLIASQNKDKLTVFAGLERKKSFVETVNNFISEMKQFNAGETDLRAIMDKLDCNSYTYKKLADILLLFEEYQKRIAGKYTDSEDYIDLFLGKISRSQLIKDNTIWIYGFDSFAPKALSVIGELMIYAGSVNVVLNYDGGKSQREKELFELGALVVHNLKSCAEGRGVKYEISMIPQSFGFNCNDGARKLPAIAFLERELYAVPYRVYPDDAGEIHIVEAANIYSEAENAASYVLHLIRDKKYRMRDIILICNDTETRAPIIKRVFWEYGLEVFSDTGRSITDNAIVTFITSLFDIAIGNFKTQSVIEALKTGFTDLEREEIIDLENYVIKYRINGSSWLKPFHLGGFEYGDEEIARLDYIRENAITPLVQFKELFKSDTNRDFILGLYSFLTDDIHMVQKISGIVKSQSEAGLEEASQETDRIWDSVLRILEQMAEIIGDEKFDGESFRSLFNTGINQIEIGVLPPTKDGLMLGTMQRTRSAAVRALVVIGANEGIMPQGVVAAGLFSNEEKELFKEQGVELMKLSSIQVTEEKLGIYRNLSKPSDRLYISYSTGDMEGKSASPSPIVTKLREIFPKADIRKDMITCNDYGLMVNGEMSGLRHLTEALRKMAEGVPFPDELKPELDWLKQNRPDRLETIIRGISFDNEAEKLNRETVESLYKKDSSKDTTLSPSRLERFSRCPFSYFVNYGLKPDERRLYQVAAREIGDIYHECLMKLAKKLTPKSGTSLTDIDSPWMTITDEELHEFIKASVDQEAMSYRGGLFGVSSEAKYRASRIAEGCEKVAKALIGQVRAGFIVNARFEAEFGRGKSIPEIIIPFGDDKVIIEGKIDRVDILNNDRVKIIDYKTGNEEFHMEEARQGYRLQLMLYLKAAAGESKKPAGIFYFHISDPLINATELESDMDKIRAGIRKNFQMNGLMVDDPEVIRNIAGDFEGFSEIAQLRNTKDGIKSSGNGESHLVTEREFDELQGEVTQKIIETVGRLLNGDTSIHPMKTDSRSACTFCDYKGICRFDTVFPGNSWNIIK